MAQQRDYAAEYARRIERGLAQGMTRTQARGHPRVYEKHVSRVVKLPQYDRRLEEGLKAIRAGKPLRSAAKTIHASPEKLGSYIQTTGVAEKQGGRWRIVEDNRPREILIHSDGQTRAIKVKDYNGAYELGRYHSAVGQFLRTNDPAVLEEFTGKTITDANGKKYVLETDPNALYRLNLTAGESFEDVYRIVA